MNINKTEQGALYSLIDATIRRLEGALDSSQYSQLFDSDIVSLIIKWRKGDTLDPSQFSQLVDFASTALAMLPLKNCEVGTPKEQSIRFSSYCLEHNTSNANCSNCPLHKKVGRCEFIWAQMPYEKGETE